MGSTPVRLTLVLVTVFAFFNLVTFGGAYLKLRADLLTTLAENVEAEFNGLDIAATPGALAALVSAKARATDPKDTVYAFRGSDGRVVGNAMVAIEPGGELRFIPLDGSGPLHEHGYIHRARRLSAGLLVVAESLEPVEALRQTFLSLLLFSLAPTFVLSLGIGVLIARRSARRVERIEGILARIASGDLGARVGRETEGADDLSRIGRSVNRMATRQEAATEAIRQVSSDIAHDLRTPLQRVSVMLNDLDGLLPESDPARDLAKGAATEAQRAVAIFQSLLWIAQIEGGQPAANFQPVDLKEVASRIAELYRPAAEDAGRSLTINLPDRPVTLSGDADLIGQAIANLIENVLRHTPAGTGLSLTVGADPAPFLSVADHGAGIPEDEREAVLRRLYRRETSRTTPGHGLGLSLVAAVAQAHDARLLLSDNAPGLIATLRFAGRPSTDSGER